MAVRNAIKEKLTTGAKLRTVKELVQLYDQFQVKEGRSKATLDWHRLSLGKFVDFLEPNSPVTDLEDQETIDLFVDYLSDEDQVLRPISVNTYLRSLRALIRWAVDNHYITVKPKIEMVKARREPKETIRPEEFERLREATRLEENELMQYRADAILLLLYTSGMRASELVKARRLDIRKRLVDGLTAHILEIDGAKNTGKREIILLAEVWSAIKLYREALDNPEPYYYGRPSGDPAWLFVSGKRPDERLTVRGLQSLLVRLGKRAGVHANPHLFRHTLATHMGNEGATLQHLMWFFGWKSPAMALAYCHKQTDTIVRTARMYNPLQSAVAEAERTRERSRRMGA